MSITDIVQSGFEREAAAMHATVHEPHGRRGPWIEIGQLVTGLEGLGESFRQATAGATLFVKALARASRPPAARGRRNAAKRARFYARQRRRRSLRVTERTGSAPDKFCHTLPDGSCDSDDPRCMHRPAPYRCPWCGAPAWREPDEIPCPSDYCHEGDHEAIE